VRYGVSPLSHPDGEVHFVLDCGVMLAMKRRIDSQRLPRFGAVRAGAAFSLVTLAAVLAVAPQAHAGAPGTGKAPGPEDASRVVRARLIASQGALVPGGKIDLGIVFTIESGWHLYWDGRNDTGFPITVEPQLPDGYTAGKMLWPVPERHISPGPLLDHVYQGAVTLVLPVTVPASARAGEKATLGCDVSWAVCREMCLIGDAQVSITLPVVAADPPPASEADRAVFARARALIPRPVESDNRPIEMAWSGAVFTVRAPGAKHMLFFPASDCGSYADAIHDGEVEGDRLALRFKSENGQVGPAAGVLEIRGRGDSPELVEFHRVHPDSP
jgi:DsbC/DsbD-like thiol-disulfide interchange protein